MAYSRTHKDETVIIAFNVSNEEKSLELPLGKKPRFCLAGLQSQTTK